MRSVDGSEKEVVHDAVFLAVGLDDIEEKMSLILWWWITRELGITVLYLPGRMRS